MACGSCGRKYQKSAVYDVMGGYKYLTDRQIRARLETFKRMYCKECPERYSCDFDMYTNCKNKVT